MLSVIMGAGNLRRLDECGTALIACLYQHVTCGVLLEMKGYLGDESSAAYTIVLHAVELVSILIFRLYSLMTIGASLGRVNVAEQLVTQQPGDSG